MPKSSELGFVAALWIGVAMSSCASEPTGELPQTDAPEGVGFLVGGGEYSPGDTAKLVLTNTTAERIGYNLCHAELQRRVGQEWVFAPRSEDPYWQCLGILNLLNPGDSATELQVIHPKIAKGVYRFSDEIEYGGDRVPIRSNGFVVR